MEQAYIFIRFKTFPKDMIYNICTFIEDTPYTYCLYLNKSFVRFMCGYMREKYEHINKHIKTTFITNKIWTVYSNTIIKSLHNGIISYFRRTDDYDGTYIYLVGCYQHEARVSSMYDRYQSPNPFDSSDSESDSEERTKAESLHLLDLSGSNYAYFNKHGIRQCNLCRQLIVSGTECQYSPSKSSVYKCCSWCKQYHSAGICELCTPCATQKRCMCCGTRGKSICDYCKFVHRTIRSITKFQRKMRKWLNHIDYQDTSTQSYKKMTRLGVFRSKFVSY